MNTSTSYRRPFALVLLTLVGLIAISAQAKEKQAEENLHRVTTELAPDGGQPVVAKLDRAGTIHLLFDTMNGPCYAKSTDHGKSFGKVIPVVASGSRAAGLEFHGADMAVGRDGVIHVAMSTNAWKLNFPKSEWAYFYANLEPGAKDFSLAQNLNHQSSEGFSIAADDEGKVTACWLSGKLYVNVSRDNGKTFARQSEIDSAFDPCNCCTTSTVYGADDRLSVLYREETNNERDMYLILWNQDRRQVSRTRISSTLWKTDACPMSSFTICPQRNGFLAVWPTKGQIYFARLDRQGNILPPGEIKTPGKSGMHTGMLGLSAFDESTLVAWKDGDHLNWQRYDKHGQPVGAPGFVKSPGDAVAGVVENDGQFILFR